jgi:hypothetical protein
VFYFFCLVFVALSFLDFHFTTHLIGICGNVEGNPLASFCYECGGPLGMAIFKLSLTLVALYIAFHVRSRQFKFYSYLIVVLGCIILGATVLYSLTLTEYLVT